LVGRVFRGFSGSGLMGSSSNDFGESSLIGGMGFSFGI
jgi:hypothetical protein